MVHQRHEGSWRIGQAETHDAVFVVAKWRVDSSLVNVAISYSDLMITRRQVQLRKVFAPLNSVE